MFSLWLILSLVDAELSDIPNPVEWEAYDKLSEELSVKWVQYGTLDSATYKVYYEFADNSSSELDVSSRSATIDCSSNEGQQVDVWYVVLSGSLASPESPKTSLLCAGVPGSVTQITVSIFLNQVTLQWNSGVDNGGSPILWYEIERRVDGGDWESLVDFIAPSVVEYTDTAEYGTSYYYSVFVVNAVGKSDRFESSIVTISNQIDAAQSVITWPTDAQSQYDFSVSVHLKDSSDANITDSSPFLLEFKDDCVLRGEFECESSSAGLLDRADYTLFSDNVEGVISATYTPALDGVFTLSVLQLLSRSIFCEFWDNIWFADASDKSETIEQLDYLELSWSETTPMIDYASSFVSAKCFVFVSPAYTEVYTVYVLADDGVRLYINDVLIIDKWDTCCEEFKTTYSMNSSQYYAIRVELKQLEGSASFKVSWSSFSQGKEAISGLHKAIRFKDSLEDLTVTIGRSTPSLSTYTAPSETRAGTSTTMTFTSKNVNGEVLANQNDVFSVEFSKSSTIISTFNSQYVSNGESTLTFSLSESGLYTVNVKLYGEDIANSPFEMNVTPGEVSAEESESSLSSLGSITAGDLTSVDFTGKDAGGNTVTETLNNVSLVFVFDEDSKFTNSLNVAFPSDWAQEFGSTISADFQQTSFTFTLFRAGNYAATLTVNGSIMETTTVAVTATDLYGQYSVNVYTSPQTAGTEFFYSIQTRDKFHNNLQITSLDSSSSEATIGSSTISGVVTNQSPGVYIATFTLQQAGTYTIRSALNSQSFPDITDLVVSALSVSSSATSSIEQVPSTARAGVMVTSSIYSRDQYSNIRADSTDTFVITNTGPVSNVDFSDLTNNNDGSFTLKYTFDTIGEYEIIVTLNTEAIVGSGTKITVENSEIRAASSDLASYPASQTVGSTEILTIEAKDEAGNVIDNPVNSVLMGYQSFSLDAKGPKRLEIPSTFTNFTAYEVDISALNVKGDYSLVLLLLQSGGLLGFYYRDSSFSQLEASVVYNNHAGESLTAYTAIDSSINFNWGTQGPSYFSPGVASLFSVKWQGKLYSEYTGSFVFYISTDNLITFTLGGETLADSITSDVVDNSITVTKDLVSGTFYDIEVLYKAGTSSTNIHLEWENFPNVARETVPSTHLFAEISSNSSPKSLTIDPGPTSAIGSRLVKHPDDAGTLTQGTLGVSKDFRVEARDFYENLQENDADTFIASLRKDDTVTEISLTSNGPGYYDGSFTPDEGGVYTLYVTFEDVIVGYTDISVSPGTTVADNTEVTGLTTISAGTQGSSTIILKDSGSNPQVTGGDTVSLGIASSSHTVPDSQILVRDNNDGTYLALYKIYVSGTYNFIAEINTVSAPSLDLEVIYGEISPSLSSSSLTEPSSGDLILGNELVVLLAFKDIYLNLYTVEPKFYVFLRQDTNSNFKDLPLELKESNLDNGELSVSGMFTLSNIDRGGTCTDANLTGQCDFSGAMSVWAYILESQVILKLFSGLEWTGGAVLNQLQDNFSYDYQAVDGLDPTNMSARIYGIIEPTTAGTYKFVLTVSDAGSLILDTTQIDTTGGVAEYTVDLEENKKYEIEVRVTNTQGTPTIRLEWQVFPDGDFSDIPGNILFHYKDETTLGGTPLAITAALS